MPLERINTEAVFRWPSFSHAVRADGHIYLSGALGTVGPTLELAEGGVGAQTRQALRNIAQVLEASGASFEDLVKVTVYMTDIGEFLEMDTAYRELIETEPARVTVGCARLSLDAAVEIDAIAYRRQDEQS